MALLNTLIYVAVVIIVLIVIVWALSFLFGMFFIAPIGYAQGQDQDQEDAGSTTIETNDTEIHIQCTENIEGLVAKCG